MNRFVVLLIVFLITTKSLHSNVRLETGDTNDRSNSRKNYFLCSIGLSRVLYRDFATSPLFYRGPGFTIGMAWQWQDTKREQFLGLDLTAAMPHALTPKNNYFQTGNSALFSNGNFYYHYLRKLRIFPSQKWDLKLGGAAVSAFNVRYNSALGNNSLGIESIMNLMLAAKATHNISRTQTKAWKLWFLHRTFQPVERYLSFQMNVGVFNFNYRPGYAYVYDAEINGSSTSLINYNFADYGWKMNGWKLGAKLEFSKFSKHGNGRRWAYIWEAANVPGRFEAFQMASHRIQFTVMINRKK
ncbi:MAG: hypothetical protein PSX36_09800 [bacterium]|nr:hypothetical protein [bacterium]